jgi:PKD repeat protein
VTITDDHNYEVVKGPIEVESNNGAEVELIEISNVLCKGESNGYIEIDVSGGSQNFDFQWSDGSSDQNLSNVPAGTYDLSVIDADTGCAYEMEFEIEEPEVLEYELEIEEPECNGNTLGEIEFFVEGGTWPMNFIFEDFETQSELITLEPGLYTVTIMDDNGCSVITPEFEIVNQEAPVAVSSAVGQFNCVQDTVYVTAESSSTGSDIAYSWFAPNLTYLGNSAVLQIDSSGLYTLEVTNTNSGCVSYSQVMVSEDYNVPVAVANVLNNIDCSNVTAMISAQGSTADSSVVYTWTTTTGNILSDPASSEIEVASAGFYDLTVNNIYSGCVSNATVEVLSVDLPEIELSGDAEFCQGNFTTICINQNTDEEVSWFVDGNLIANSVCVDVDASFELEVVLSNTITGCEATEFVAIEALEAPEIELLGDLIFCSGTTSTICLDNSNNNDVVWRQNGMEIGTDNCITLDATGQIEVTLTNTTTGCASEEAFNTEVYMNPVIEIAEPAILDCSLTSVELDLTVDSETELFAWYDGQNILLSNSEDLTVTQAGNYTVVATNIYGCESVSSVNVEANLDELPIAEYSFTSDQFSFNFEDKSQGNIKSWLWDFGDGNSSTEQNPSYTYANAGFYTVVLTTSNDCGTSKITQEVLATSPMQITTVVNNVSCSGYSDGSIQLSVYGGLPTYSYNWSGPSNGLLGPQAAGLSSGSYHIEITDAAGMSISAEIELLEPDPIVVGADITPAAQGTFDGAIVLEIEGGNGGYSFQWSNGSTSQNVTGLAQGTYTVIVTDEKNCTTEEVFDVLGTTGIEELDFVSKFELSPNPAGDFVNLKIELDELKPVSVRVISVIGQIHHDIEMNTISLEENINLSYLPNGLYVIELRSANQVSIRKLIVSH